jgi:Cytoskeletal adhesion
MEMDEVRNGPITLEAYKKPAAYTRRRKPALLSVKPLYLHMQISISTVP